MSCQRSAGLCVGPESGLDEARSANVVAVRDIEGWCVAPMLTYREIIVQKREPEAISIRPKL